MSKTSTNSFNSTLIWLPKMILYFENDYVDIGLVRAGTVVYSIPLDMYGHVVRFYRVNDVMMLVILFDDGTTRSVGTDSLLLYR